MFGGYGLQQRAENLNADILRQQRAEQVLGRLLVNVIHLRGTELRSGFALAFGGVQSHTGTQCGFLGFLLLFFRRLFGQAHCLLANLLDGQDLLDNQPLRDDRLELVEHDVHGVNFFALVTRNHVCGQGGGLRKLNFAQNANVLTRDLNLSGSFTRFPLGFHRFRQIGQTLRLHLGRRKTAPQKIAALASDRLDIDALPVFGIQEPSSGFGDIRVKAPASPLSPVTTIRRMFFSGRCARSGCFGSPVSGS